MYAVIKFSSVVAQKSRKKAIVPFLNFGLLRNCPKTFTENFSPIKKILGLKDAHFGKFRVLSTHSLLCQKFAAVCQNSVGKCAICLPKNCNFLPRLLFSRRRR